MQVVADASATSRAKSVESVMHALMSIGRLMRQRPSAETLDIGTFWLLKMVGTSGTVRVTDLASSCNLDVSTVSRHLAQLHKAGMIERAPDPVDRRAQLVKLSSAGQEALTAALQARRALLERSLEGWAPTDLEQLDQVLTRLVEDIDTLTEKLEKA
ncbi:MAG TPA: MarR family transcriptional regulator [Propionibacteriaceae bacterium]|nr:MarR family transcriptional regulator [Propionibacteriaceae bacterium]